MLSIDLALPDKLRADCCPGKTCGKTELYLDSTISNHVVKVGYRRVSNGDWYSQLMDEPELLEWIRTNKHVSAI